MTTTHLIFALALFAIGYGISRAVRRHKERETERRASEAREARLRKESGSAVTTSPETEDESGVRKKIAAFSLPGSEARNIARGAAISSVKERIGKLRMAYDDRGPLMSGRKARIIRQEILSIGKAHKLKTREVGLKTTNELRELVESIEAAEAERIGQAARGGDPHRANRVETRDAERAWLKAHGSDESIVAIGKDIEEVLHSVLLDNSGEPRRNDCSATS